MTQVAADPGGPDAGNGVGSSHPHAPGDASGRRPAGVDDATVRAVGKVTEALEWVERARGHLYEFHQLMGHADLTLGEAVDELEVAGQVEMAHSLSTDVLGRNVKLPPMEIGDLLAIHCSGAYGPSASPNNFISHDLPKEIFIEGGQILLPANF